MSNPFKAAIFAIALAVTALPASAMDVPLTQKDLDSAIAFGQSHKLEQLYSAPGYGYGTESDFINQWKSPRSPRMILSTPWYAIAMLAQQAKAKYADLDHTTIASYQNAHTLTIMGYLYAPGMGANSDAAIVIKQGDRVIHPSVPTKVDPNEKIITRRRHDGPAFGWTDRLLYETSLSAGFNSDDLDLAKPFSVVLANTLDGEWYFKVDLTKIR